MSATYVKLILVNIKQNFLLFGVQSHHYALHHISSYRSILGDDILWILHHQLLSDIVYTLNVTM